MADATGGMFEARLKLADDSSETIDSISAKIDKAVGNTEQLQKEFKKLDGRLQKMHESTKSILKDTNDLGMIPSALLGINDKGSVKDQFLGLRKMAGDFFDFLKGMATDAMLTFADAGLSAAIAVGKLYYIMSGMAALMKFPAIFVGSAIEANKLVGVMEDLRHEIKMTNDETIAAAKGISTVMLQTGSDIELVLDAYGTLAQQGELNKKNALELGKATVFLAEAWRMGAAELVEFNLKMTRLFDIAPGGLKGVASSMDLVARTTRITRQELMGLAESLEHDILFRIPKAFRAKVMPSMIADISAVAGAWKDMFGNPADVLEGFRKVVDEFNTEGIKLRTQVIALGGATEKELAKMIKGGDAGGFWMAQAKAVQNLKDQLGDEEFTRTISIWADHLGIARDEYVRMSEANLTQMAASRKAAKEELASTESIREAWDRAQGVFNEVWKRLENIGKALLISIGEPLLNVLVPALDWFGKKLIAVIEAFSGIGNAEKAMLGLGTVLGTIVAVAKAAITPIKWIVGAFQWMSTKFATFFNWLGGTALPAVVGWLKVAALMLGKIIAVAAIFVVIVKALYDWGSAFVAAFAPALEKVWTVLKIIGVFYLAVLAPALVLVGVLIYALIEYWDEFYKAMEPGIKALKKVWSEITLIFYELGSAMSGMFGEAEAGTTGTMSVVADILKFVAQAIGSIISALLQIVAFFVRGIGVAIAGLMLVFSPILGWIAALWDAFSLLFKNIEKWWGYLSSMFDKFLTGDILGAFIDLGKAIATIFIGIFQFILDYLFSGLNAIIKSINMLPFVNIPTLQFDIAGAVGLDEGGITKSDNIPAVLHKNEAVIPLEKFPEVVGSTVYVEQESVVEELKLLRASVERMVRRTGVASKLQGGN